MYSFFCFYIEPFREFKPISSVFVYCFSCYYAKLKMIVDERLCVYTLLLFAPSNQAGACGKPSAEGGHCENIAFFKHPLARIFVKQDGDAGR